LDDYEKNLVIFLINAVDIFYFIIAEYEYNQLRLFDFFDLSTEFVNYEELNRL